jgi:3,4-dihydroxy 2-butanone 4-phosphate synthase / GTP cyclohydrolase II
MKSTTRFRSEFGTYQLTAYHLDGGEHAALVSGDLQSGERPLVRVQSSCLTGTAFHAVLCDCRQQLETALGVIAREGTGCVIYLAQEGRSHGLVEKINHLKAISQGADTVDAALERGVDPDLRCYDVVRPILDDLLGGVRPIRLLTNNPHKLLGIEEAGVPVAERVALETSPTPDNLEYLRVKKRRMGHLLTQV